MIQEQIELSKDQNRIKLDISQSAQEDPISILKNRFAKGEITKTEYNEMISLLNGVNQESVSTEKKICGSCGEENTINTSFCTSCGTSLPLK